MTFQLNVFNDSVDKLFEKYREAFIDLCPRKWAAKIEELQTMHSVKDAESVVHYLQELQSK